MWMLAIQYSVIFRDILYDLAGSSLYTDKKENKIVLIFEKI
jgi:hypothetical protein